MAKDFGVILGNEDVVVTDDEEEIRTAQKEGRYHSPDNRPEDIED